MRSSSIMVGIVVGIAVRQFGMEAAAGFTVSWRDARDRFRLDRPTVLLRAAFAAPLDLVRFR
jgi:hypothetical protein